MSVPAVACLLSHSCIILWLSHQIWRIGLAKLLSADSSLYESTSVPVCAQICQCVSTKRCDVHLSSFLCIHICDSSPASLSFLLYFLIPFWLTVSFIQIPMHPKPFFKVPSLSIDISICNITVNDQRKFDAIQKDSPNLSHGLHHHHSFSSPSSGSQWQAAAKYRVLWLALSE